jgi:biotin carboxyl carrier protein
MKYQVKIEDRIFQVEVGELDETPIRVKVDGEMFQVWTEPNGAGETGRRTRVERVTFPTVPQAARTNGKSPALTQAAKEEASRDILAPMPGTILSVEVKTGERVEYGQELIVLEAMKMKNSIRAPRAGRVGAVRVSTGQTVKHRELLVELED